MALKFGSGCLGSRCTLEHGRGCVVTLTPRLRLALRSRSTLVVRAIVTREEVNVLVVGGGGREHALSWKLRQSPICGDLYCTPGNAGIAMEAGIDVLSPALNTDDHSAVIHWCNEKEVGLVVVGPEAPLVAGLADALRGAGIRVVGPSAQAAKLEGSKAFMKDLCKRYNIPTAEYEKFTDAAAAKAYVRRRSAPLVVKANGLAAGKGVIIANTVEEAERAVEDMLVGGAFGEAGREIVVEEFLDGEEASFFALVDGEQCLALASAQDHKAVGEGDTGPNTGGMGAYSPAPVVTRQLEAQVMRDIVQATARAMAAEGVPFSGVLFAGLMIKNGKAKLLEHNVRFGDPECQALMLRLESDLLPALLATAEGRLGEVQLAWSPQAALTVVLAAAGYPGEYRKGTPISGLDDITTAKVFHSGTALDEEGQLVAAGGRVLSVTATGANIGEAQRKAYRAVADVEWSDAYFRRDIGWRAVGSMKATSRG